VGSVIPLQMQDKKKSLI